MTVPKSDHVIGDGDVSDVYVRKYIYDLCEVKVNSIA